MILFSSSGACCVHKKAAESEGVKMRLPDAPVSDLIRHHLHGFVSHTWWDLILSLGNFKALSDFVFFFKCPSEQSYKCEGLKSLPRNLKTLQDPHVPAEVVDAVYVNGHNWLHLICRLRR